MGETSSTLAITTLYPIVPQIIVVFIMNMVCLAFLMAGIEEVFMDKQESRNWRAVIRSVFKSFLNTIWNIGCSLVSGLALLP